MATAENPIHNTDEVEQLMLESWLPVAEKHAKESGGNIAVLDIDPELYPAQALDTHHISGRSQGSDVVKFAAQTVEPLFDETSAKLLSDSESEGPEAMKYVAGHINNGGNVIIGTNHGKVTDVVMALAAVYGHLKEEGVDFRSSLVISKMISLLASSQLKDEEGNPLVAIQALQVVSDDIFMSYPRTETTHSTPLARQLPDVIDAHNKAVSRAVKENLEEGGVLFAMAPSGTTDKLDTAGKVVTMGEVTPGTAKLMTAKNTLVLPIAAHFGEKPFMLASDMPRQLSSVFEAHDVMRSIARTLQANVPDVDFEYR